MNTLTFREIVQAFIELSFPVAVAVFLLVKTSQQIDGLKDRMIEVRIALNLILERLDIKEEYEKQVMDFRRKKEDDDEY